MYYGTSPPNSLSLILTRDLLLMKTKLFLLLSPSTSFSSIYLLILLIHRLTLTILVLLLVLLLSSSWYIICRSLKNLLPNLLFYNSSLTILTCLFLALNTLLSSLSHTLANTAIWACIATISFACYLITYCNYSTGLVVLTYIVVENRIY